MEVDTGELTLVPQESTEPDSAAQWDVGILGLGYVGLPLALELAESGCSVVGFDISQPRLNAISAGTVDLPETDLARLRRHMASEELILSVDPSRLGRVQTVIVCVPTPVDAHRVPDLTFLEAAGEVVREHLAPGQTVIVASTTYVGCTRDLFVRPLQEMGWRVGQDVFVAFSPERIDPGGPPAQARHAPRVVGGVTDACSRRAAEVLGRVATRVHQVSSPEAAELSKLLENTFRAVNIALVNEFADAGREFGLDISEVIEAAATKPYGFMPFFPGPGAGGHCIPCDPQYLLWQVRGHRMQLPVTEAALGANMTRPGVVAARTLQVLAEVGRPPLGAKVLLVGVTYKGGVADTRESSALAIMSDLMRAGAEVAYADPLVASLDVAGRTLEAVTDPAEWAWDLVLIHTLHPGFDYEWINSYSLVVDATYKAFQVPHRRVV
jgi:UDP-N-acetyl-D-glucosamine dehydrogenase